MEEEKTSSQHWREQGNAIYITAKDSLSPIIRKDRLRNAANCYYKAYNFSNDEEEKVSAAKNLGMVSWKTARVDENTSERLSLLVHMYKEAFKYFSFAYHHSGDVKPQDWRDGLLASAKGCWEELKGGRISMQEMLTRSGAYYDIVHSVEIEEIKAECYLELGNCHFHAGITAIQNGDFKKGTTSYIVYMSLQ